MNCDSRRRIVAAESAIKIDAGKILIKN